MTTPHDHETVGARNQQQQHHVNLIWEITQGLIAVAVTGATLYAATKLTLKDSATEAAFLLLSNAFFLVIGFYFGRTNHARPTGKQSRGGDQ